MENKYLKSWLVGMAVVAAGWGIAQDAGADTVYLKRGGTIQGEAVQGESTVEVRMDGGSTTFNREEIERIEKDGDHRGSSGPGSASASMARLKEGASKAVSKVKRQTSKAIKDVKKKTAGWNKPIGRSNATVAKEKMANDSMSSMKKALQKKHQQERAVSKQKRQLKKEGFNIH